jgi:transcriptional regulator with XRE-family HTH domain
MSRHDGVYLRVRDHEALHEAQSSRYATLAELSLRTGVSVAYLSHLACGRRGRIAARHAAKIEDELGVPRGTFFELDPADVELLDPYRSDAA